MKILIIGSEGFVGSHCVRYFQGLGNTVVGVDLVDAKNTPYQFFRISRLQPNFSNIFLSNSFDLCIHAAGNGNVAVSIEQPKWDFESNVIDTFEILESIRNYNPTCKLVFFSSAAVYGNPVSLPIKEIDSPAPISPYGWHKLLSESILKEYYVLYGIKSICLRPFSVYGPGLKKQIIWDIYQKYRKSEIIELFGTGKESRDFIYIEDLLLAIDILIKNRDFETINIATGIETTIEEVTESFNNFVDKKAVFKFNNLTKPGDPLYWKADVSKLTNLGFKPKYTFNKGMEVTLKWLKNEA